MYPYLKDFEIDIPDLCSENPSCLPTIALKKLTHGVVLDLFNLAKELNVEMGHSVVLWISRLCRIPFSTINQSAVVSKLYRAMKTMKGKRGEGKFQFLQSPFSLATQTAATTASDMPASDMPAKRDLSIKKQLDETKQQLEKKKETVQQLHEKHRQLKRKYDRLSTKEDKIKSKKMKTEKTVTSLQKELHIKSTQLRNAQARIQHNKAKGDKYFQLYLQTSKTVRQLEQRIPEPGAAAGLPSTQESLELCQMKKEVCDLKISVDYLQSLLADTEELQLLDMQSRSYTPEAIKCVMNLTDLKVPSAKVGRVIKEVSSLCGKTPNQIPSTSTVNRIVDAKLAVAQRQISEVLEGEVHTTLYTDETRKYGRTSEAFVITDQRQTSYILGLREMNNKSSQTTLDTFKEILEDINDQCHQKEKDNMMHKGYQLLANIRDTMSDRASTEKAFNVLLEKFRTSILPQVVDGWADLNEQEKNVCSKMNNFFCGLHLLVGLADACEATLKKFEQTFLGEKHVGSATSPELKMYHKNESGVLRLIRTCCRCFAVGEDEKSGVSQEWKTYLQSKASEKNYIVRFKHNRFNLVFVLGHAVYYHHQDIAVFLDTVHGHSNNLLKAVALDIKENLFLAGAKSFGLISKFITGPLWRLLETKGHILEMNAHYKTLVDFLSEGSSDTEIISAFMTGENTPFETVLGEEDNVLAFLISEKPAVDEIVCPILQSLFKTMHELLSRMVMDHLPGGKYWHGEEETIEQTKSAMKHNRLPEFVFGQLDQLLRYRPNATLLTNESFLMYSNNRTREWLDSLDDTTRNQLLIDCKTAGVGIRKKFKSRLREIERQRLAQQKKRQHALEEKERKRLKAAENITNDVCYYGLWQSEEQVKEGLERLSQTEQRKAIEAQLKFRKQVLKQKHEDAKIYSFSRKNESGRYMKLGVEDLKNNLLVLIKETMRSTTEEEHREGVPLFVGKHIEHTFTDGIWKGYVISVVPGFPKWYNVQYENDPAVYAYNLYEDYEKGDLKIALHPYSTLDEKDEDED